MQRNFPVIQCTLPTIALLCPCLLNAAPFASADVTFDTAGRYHHHTYAIGDDLNNDGIADIVAATRDQVDFLSGTTGEPLFSVSVDPYAYGLTIIDDTNDDGVRDIAISFGDSVRVLSGADGSVLRSFPTVAPVDTIIEVADMTGDGLNELVAFGVHWSEISLLDGSDLSFITVFNDGSLVSDVAVIDDQDGDFKPDIVVLNTPPNDQPGSLVIHSTANLLPVRNLPLSEPIDSPDEDYSALWVSAIRDANDNRSSVIAVAGVIRQPDIENPAFSVVSTHSSIDGALINAHRFPDRGFPHAHPSKAFSVLDWDGDGVNEAILGLADFNAELPEQASTEVIVASLDTGMVLQTFAEHNRPYQSVNRFDIGDVNDDGLHDLLLTSPPELNATDGLLPTGLLFIAKDVATYAEEFFMTGSWFDLTRDSFDRVFVEFSRGESGVQMTVFWRVLPASDDIRNLQWYVAGPVSLDNPQALVSMELYEASGAEFGANFRSDDVRIESAGNILFSVASCTSADLTATFDDGSVRFLPLHSIRAIYGLPCLKAEDVPDTNRSGVWWNPERAGEGVFVDWFDFGESPFASVLWLTHLEGQAYWVDGVVDNGEPQEPIDFLHFIEALNFQEHDCLNATLSYATRTLEEGTIPVERGFAGPVIGGCSDSH